MSKYVKATAAPAVAPITAARLLPAPAAVATTTSASATITSLWPLRNGTHSNATAADPAVPPANAAPTRQLRGDPGP